MRLLVLLGFHLNLCRFEVVADEINNRKIKKRHVCNFRAYYESIIKKTASENRPKIWEYWHAFPITIVNDKIINSGQEMD